MEKVKSKSFLWIYIYFGILTSLRSTYVIEAFPALESVSKILTVLVYLPFAAAIFYKLLTDIRDFKKSIKSVSNCIFYVFTLYYVGLCAYRFANGMEVKENFYYTIVFLGAIATYMLLRDGRIFMPKQELEKNLLWITAFFVLYRLAYVLIGVHFISKSPININLTSGAVGLLLPLVGNMLMESYWDKKKSILPWLVFCGGLIVVATTGSRAIFALTVANVAVLVLVALIRRRGVIRIVSAVVMCCVVVAGLAFADVGKVRYSLYRQAGIEIPVAQTVDPTTGSSAATTPTATEDEEKPSEKPDKDSDKEKPDKDPDKEDPTETPTTPTTPEQITDMDQLKAQKQIDASDRMRKKLVQYGMKQVEKNPLFGTGDVMYKYRMNKKYVFLQSSHNFLIESVICYGLVGLLMIAALFIAMLIEAKLFVKTALRRWNYKIMLLLTIAFYFALGFVQPTVYDSLICPLFLLVIVASQKALQETQ